MSPEESGGDGAPEPDDALNGPPPDPLDRPWVHPSELRSFVTTPSPPPREPRPREWVIGVGSAVAAVLATILVLVAFGALGGRHRSALPPPVVTNPGDVVDYAVAERVGTAVSSSVVTVRARTGDTTRPVGSGVVVTSDRVMTAAHNLPAGVSDMVVVTNIGTEFPAKVVGTDPQTDLALLSVSDADLQLARFGGSSPPRVGQTVVAVSAGAHYRVGINVVSDRDVMVDAGTGIDVAGLLETGIPVTPEMSGGALIDPDGNLVGVLTRATTGSPDGLAVPVSTVRDVRDQLDGSGKATHGWLGVLCDKDPADTRPQGGAVVEAVIPDSPAAGAGFAPGDVIVRAAGQMVSGRPDLVAAVRGLRPQDQLEVQYLRDDKPRTVTVTLKAADPQTLLYAPAMG
ncbi:MAG TPA: trypsin-like peptidase domain-containing protein [Acidimicrobiia bacterium]